MYAEKEYQDLDRKIKVSKTQQTNKFELLTSNSSRQ